MPRHRVVVKGVMRHTVVRQKSDGQDTIMCLSESPAHAAQIAAALNLADAVLEAERTVKDYLVQL